MWSFDPLFYLCRTGVLFTNPKIVFVGQETCRWYTEWWEQKKDLDSLEVDSITQFYREIRLWLVQNKRRVSPYWQGDTLLIARTWYSGSRIRCRLHQHLSL
jgi:hypothetical protein